MTLPLPSHFSTRKLLFFIPTPSLNQNLQKGLFVYPFNLTLNLFCLVQESIDFWLPCPRISKKCIFIFAQKYGNDDSHFGWSQKNNCTRCDGTLGLFSRIKASRMSPSPTRRRKGELPQDICSSNQGQKRSNYCAKFLERTVIFSNY